VNQENRKTIQANKDNRSFHHGSQEQRVLLHSFLQEELSRGRTEKSIVGLKHNLTPFFSYLNETGLSYRFITVSQAQAYQGWLIDKGKAKTGDNYKSNSIRSLLSSVTTFYEYLIRKGLVLTNGFKDIKKVAHERKVPRSIPTEDGMNKLLESLTHFDEPVHLKEQISWYKTHVISELMYSSGLRSREVATLRTGDIDLDRGYIHLKEGKGGYERIAYLNGYSKEILSLYIQLKPIMDRHWERQDETLLFGIGAESFNKYLNRYLKAVSHNLDIPSITSHSFRHALGYHLLRAGCSVRRIKDILGHKVLKSTEIYTKVDKEDLKDVLDSFHPRKFKTLSDLAV
jgi:integrase/recombinase XerD